MANIIKRNNFTDQSFFFGCILFGTYSAWKLWSTRKTDEEKIEIGDEKCIKEGFRLNSVPKNIDVIVIGSGIAGLTVASLMAQEKKVVLLLEQHDVLGGSTHTFQEKGFEFDTGLHYVGGHIGSKTSSLRKHFDCITQGGVEWQKMDDVYDFAILRNENTYEKFSMHSDVSMIKEDLIAAFPKEKKAIHKYFNTIQQSNFSFALMYVLKCIPYSWIQQIAQRLLQPYLNSFDRTTQHELAKITKNKKLSGILTYLYGDFGDSPSRSSFAMHSVLAQHFIGGAYFPIGGPSMIARSIVPIIEKSKGKAFVRAPVSSIIIDKNNKACGVVIKGQRIHASIVVSTISSTITYKNLIPDTHKTMVENHLKIIENPSVASEFTLMSMFIGMEGTAEELKIPKSNMWIFPSWDHDANLENYRQDPNAAFPVVFISFASSNDPTYSTRFPKKCVASVIAPCYYEHVETHSDKRVKHRGKEYQNLKNTWKNRLLDVFGKEFPHLKEKIAYVDLGTAVTNDFYLGTHRGACYGLGHTPERFKEIQVLSPQTPIQNLYLSGQDILTCGIAGGLLSGYMTSYSISPRLIWKYLGFHVTGN